MQEGRGDLVHHVLGSQHYLSTTILQLLAMNSGTVRDTVRDKGDTGTGTGTGKVTD